MCDNTYNKTFEYFDRLVVEFFIHLNSDLFEININSTRVIHNLIAKNMIKVNQSTYVLTAEIN